MIDFGSLVIGPLTQETRHKGGFLSAATWRLDPWRKAPTP